VTRQVASEAAIASNLHHRNVVAAYSHNVHSVASEVGHELGIYKFVLIQVSLISRRACCLSFVSVSIWSQLETLKSYTAQYKDITFGHSLQGIAFRA
jgi:hypothetical protein